MSTIRNNITIIKESGVLLASEIHEDPTTDYSTELGIDRVTPFTYYGSIPYSIMVKGDIVEDYSITNLYESILHHPSTNTSTWKNEFKVRTFIEGDISDYQNIKFDVDPNAPVVGGKPRLYHGIYLCVTDSNGNIVQQFDFDDNNRRVERILDSGWLHHSGSLITNEETDETVLTALNTGSYYGYLLKIEHNAGFDGLLARVENGDGREFSTKFDLSPGSTHKYMGSKINPAAQYMTIIPFNVTLSLEGEIDTYIQLDGEFRPLNDIEYEEGYGDYIGGISGLVPESKIDFVVYGESYQD